MKNAERRLQLTSKFVQMGNALVEEGRLKEDLIIAQLGSMVIFLGDLVSMYSAKKLVESMEENKDPELMAIRIKADSDTYENILDGIDGLIDDAKNGKLDDEDSDEDSDEDEDDKN
jgi:hypothetical protein